MTTIPNAPFDLALDDLTGLMKDQAARLQEIHNARNTLRITAKDGAVIPHRAHPTDAGLDLFAHGDYFIPTGEAIKVGTGISAAIPENHVGLLFARSSLHTTFPGARMSNGVGVIDSAYRGEIIASITGKDDPILIHDGDKIVQLVILPIITPQVLLVDSLDDTDRGDGGFGSTGKKAS